MIGLLKRWLRLADSEGKLPHRWPATRRDISTRLYRAANARGLIDWNRIDDCYINEAGKRFAS